MKVYGNLLSIFWMITMDQDDLIRNVITSWKDKLERGLSERRSSNARQLDCVLHDMKQPKFILRKSADLQRSIYRVKFTKAIARHSKIRDKNHSLRYICPGASHQRSPTLQIGGSVSRGDRMTRARCPRRSVEAVRKCFQVKRLWRSNILLTFGR